MIRCQDAMNRLWEFLDGELAQAEESAVKEHLDVCSKCFPEYDFQRTYLAYVRRLGERDEAPPELRRRLFEMLLVQDGGGEVH